MQITVIGTGYVGLVTGACFADAGHKVICIDKDKGKIEKLNDGKIPFYEPNLEELILKSLKHGNIKFQKDHSTDSLNSEIFFIAVGTPQSDDGSVNMDFVEEAATEIGKGCLSDSIVVNKSTMAIGSTSRVQNIIDDHTSIRKVSVKISVVANPEFLREGSAIKDFTNPDRVIVGTLSEDALKTMRELYKPFLSSDLDNFIIMDTKSAELTKYAANAMLAARISFMNEMALISEAVEADIELVKLGVGLDQRIGKKFLNPGIGYGGSCFPKDLNALIYSAKQFNIDLELLSAVQSVNESQKNLFTLRLENLFKDNGGLEGKTIALWGLSYKPETDDIRDAPSISLIEGLLYRGAKIAAYDPVANQNMQFLFPESSTLSYKDSAKDCLVSADALIVCTEWKEFSAFEFSEEHTTSLEIILDGRNCLDKDKLSLQGLNYKGIGR